MAITSGRRSTKNYRKHKAWRPSGSLPGYAISIFSIALSARSIATANLGCHPSKLCPTRRSSFSASSTPWRRSIISAASTYRACLCATSMGSSRHNSGGSLNIPKSITSLMLTSSASRHNICLTCTKCQVEAVVRLLHYTNQALGTYLRK